MLRAFGRASTQDKVDREEVAGILDEEIRTRTAAAESITSTKSQKSSSQRHTGLLDLILKLFSTSSRRSFVFQHRNAQAVKAATSLAEATNNSGLAETLM